MNILGVQLRKPSFNEVTAAAVMALGLWLAYVGALRAGGSDFEPINAGGTLLIIFWGCVCVRLGIHVGKGLSHLVLNVGFGALLLGVYQACVTLLA